MKLCCLQDNGRPELQAENAAYAREVAELFASSRRGIESAPASAPPRQACAPRQVARARRLPARARALAQYSHLQRYVTDWLFRLTDSHATFMCDGRREGGIFVAVSLMVPGHLPSISNAQGNLKQTADSCRVFQDSNSTSSSSIRRQQDRSSSTPAGTRREDMLPIDSSTGPRSRSLAAIEVGASDLSSPTPAVELC